jgi:hypothetical protein
MPVHLIHYLDDFLFLVAPHSDAGNHVPSLALELLDIQIVLHKIKGPACVVVFLGILIDSVAGEPQTNCSPRGSAQKKTCSRKELESFLGHCCHAATVVCPERAFLRELFNLLLRGKQSHHVTRLSGGARWKFFLQHGSGHSFSLLLLHIVFSDASGSWGCGGFTEDVG